MKESPIPFKGDMVRAVLSGQKTQTRRPMKPIPVYPDAFGGLRREIHDGQVHFWASGAELPAHKFRCPYGQPDDRLWVKETHARHPQFAEVAYRADGEEFEDADGFTWHPKWTPSIFMPRALCRIILEITDIRVERVQNITSDGAIAEGAYEVRKVGDDIAHATWTMDGLDWRYDTPREAFAATWDSLYAARGLGWDVNPWIWVVTFKRAEEVCQKN
ncbi:hypothetical protein [uncultured Desulfovibrio sp.]|uniref:hypothetical protein n=1 Tax=uncultured Desulfovibrio sp. TaxID=167968 RepID=UPI0026DCCD39|nr:hypothetical protein [uncultured Desulfovibrio sp.]